MTFHRATRTILASPHAIFRAMLDPQLLPKWRASLGWEGQFLEFDPRVEGKYRMAWRWPTPGSGDKESERHDGQVEGQFVEIAPDELIVEHVAFPNGGIHTPVQITTTLGAVRDGTKVTISIKDIPPVFQDDGFQVGLDNALKALADLLE